MKIPDELLSAFVNGELEGAERQRIEQAIARDRRIAQRVAKQRALRSQLQTALDEVLPRPVRAERNPPHMLLPFGSAQIIDLARVRAQRAQGGRPRRAAKAPRFVIATSLLIGLILGLGIARLMAENSLAQYRDGTLLARGALARALNEQLGGSAPIGSNIRIGATYRAKLGNYCRSFSTAGSLPVTGLACRLRDQWQLQTLLNGTVTAATLADLNQNITGAPLATATELQLRGRDWK